MRKEEIEETVGRSVERKGSKQRRGSGEKEEGRRVEEDLGVGIKARDDKEIEMNQVGLKQVPIFV